MKHHEKELIFLTFRDFSKAGGGAMRVTGIVNSSSLNKNIKCTLLANLEDSEKRLIDKSILYTPLKVKFSIFEKRTLQLLLSFLPYWLVAFLFKNKIENIKNILSMNNLLNKEIIFLEYLDISIGYVLKKKGYIKNYLCDIHGLVPNEFKQKKDNKALNYFKYISAVLLDKKVFRNSNGVIFASEAMKKYFYANHPSLKEKKSIILPYFVTKKTVVSSIDNILLSKIKSKYKIKEDEKIIFFAGNFKYLGGIVDLVDAFGLVTQEMRNVRLFILGEGEEIDNIKSMITKYSISDKVILAGLIPYSELRTYQEIASVIVCPDKENLYSNMILHLKYFDSLISNKIVINGSFKSVNEINENEKLSINFIPSNVNDLKERIIFCLKNENQLIKKFSKNSSIVYNHFTYENNSNIIEKMATTI